MEYNRYTVKLTDKTQFDISPEKYEKLMQESTSGKDGVIINGDYITFKSIYGITGYHDKPVQTRQSLPAPTKTSRYDLWMEATKRNRDRIKKGIQPYANWRVTTEGELIEDPEYYKTKVAVLSDYK